MAMKYDGAAGSSVFVLPLQSFAHGAQYHVVRQPNETGKWYLEIYTNHNKRTEMQNIVIVGALVFQATHYNTRIHVIESVTQNNISLCTIGRHFGHFMMTCHTRMRIAYHLLLVC